MDTVCVWFRNDLRLHDHAPMAEALRTGARVLPVYCLDPRHFAATALGFPKTGAYRARFLTESLQDLRQQLRQLGSDLWVFEGEPEQILPKLAEVLTLARIYYYQSIASEETSVEQRLAQNLRPIGTSLHPSWGHTLCHLEDLPFRLGNLPALFTHFRQGIEQCCVIRPPLPSPKAIGSPLLPPSLATFDLGDIAIDLPPIHDRAVMAFHGGERAGLARLQEYFWDRDCLQFYKETRNGLLGADYSTKFSPWLAMGCLSPRWIYAELKRYESDRICNESTYWLFFELLWRDYFSLIALEQGDRLFRLTGLQGISLPWKNDRAQFAQWQQGLTGIPWIDANMRELLSTGFMSNRGRQNVASFLTKNLGINWQWGAAWFESQLIDYDVGSNWGNWNYAAGIGNDARGFRYFNPLKQAQTYDPAGKYVKHWIPELAALPESTVHEPWNSIPPVTAYPAPMVDLARSVAQQEQAYTQAQQKRQGKAQKKPRSGNSF